MSDTPIEPLLERLRGGDASAASELYLAFEPFLRGLVRRRLVAGARSRFDSADVVQSAWASVLDGLRQGRWSFPDQARLRAFLTRVVLYRLYDRTESALRQTRREEVDVQLVESAKGPEPRPSELVRADALWQTLVDACPPEHRPILELRRLGFSCEEIGERTGLHPGSVRRVLRRLAQHVAFDAQVSEPVQ